MKEFLKKNGDVMGLVAGIGSVLAAAGSYVAFLIKSDKREIKRYKNLEDEHNEYIKYLKSLNDRG